MLLQTNSYIVPKDKRAEHARLVRRFRHTLARLGCEHFEVYEQVGANWAGGDSGGRFVQIMRFRDRQHQIAVHAAERIDPDAQRLIAEFCDLINIPYQQQQGLFAIGYYQSVLPVTAARVRVPSEATDEDVAEAAGVAAIPLADPLSDRLHDEHARPQFEENAEDAIAEAADEQPLDEQAIEQVADEDAVEEGVEEVPVEEAIDETAGLDEPAEEQEPQEVEAEPLEQAEDEQVAEETTAEEEYAPETETEVGENEVEEALDEALSHADAAEQESEYEQVEADGGPIGVEGLEFEEELEPVEEPAEEAEELASEGPAVDEDAEPVAEGIDQELAQTETEQFEDEREHAEGATQDALTEAEASEELGDEWPVGDSGADEAAVEALDEGSGRSIKRPPIAHTPGSSNGDRLVHEAPVNGVGLSLTTGPFSDLLPDVTEESGPVIGGDGARERGLAAGGPKGHGAQAPQPHHNGDVEFFTDAQIDEAINEAIRELDELDDQAATAGHR